MDAESRLKIMVYHRNSWKVFWILMGYGGRFWKADELIARHSEAETGCPVTYTYTKETVKDLLQGFDITDMKVDHIFPYLIPEYVRYEYKKVWYFQVLPEQMFRWMEKRWGWHLCVTAKTDRQGTDHV